MKFTSVLSVALLGLLQFGSGFVLRKAVSPPLPSKCSTRPTVARRMRAGPLQTSPIQLEQLRTQARGLRETVSQLEADLSAQKLELTKVESRIATLVNPPTQKVIETKKRSLVKALGWRLTAGLVTFCTSYYFTHSLASAGAIVGSDFLSKAGTMYIGERLFSKVNIGKSSSGAESPMRSIAKALIWRAFAFCQTMIVSIIFLKEASTGAKIAGADTIIKTTLMVVYDQIWAKIQWGRELENLGGDGI